MAIEIKNNNMPTQGSENGNEGQVKTPAPQIENNEDLEAPYTDKRSVTISLVKNYSAYRKLNMKVLGQRHEVIGSSVTSCRVLSSNKGEVDCYFPQLIGLSPTNPVPNSTKQATSFLFLNSYAKFPPLPFLVCLISQ